MQPVHLQVLTSYSLLNSTNRIPELVSQAKQYGYEYLAITDYNVMHGVIEFYQECQRQDIKPVIGLTLQYDHPEHEKQYSLLLFAKDLVGYQHLMKISSLKMQKKVNEALLLEELTPFTSSLFCVIPDKNSELEYYLQQKKQEEAHSFISKLVNFFDKDSLYLGLNLRKNQMIETSWSEFIQQQKIPITALQDVRYLLGKDEFALQVLEHIRNGQTANPDLLPSFGEKYLTLPTEMKEVYQEHQLESCLQTTIEIATQCQFEIPLHQKLLPHFDLPDNQDAASYLKALCERNLPLRVKEVTSEYQQRLNMELSVIHEMGFDDYFLIIGDVVSFIHDNQIIIGAGRGSAAGSLVSYVLSITDVDPIEHQLLFERFLSRERYTMPDIDLDIPDNRREEVLQYVSQKYGTSHMAQIATFGTMAAKMALRDVARVFSLSQSEANTWSAAIPNELKITLSEAYKKSAKLRNLVQESERHQLLFQTAQLLEGLPRHVSTHAAGVVISDLPLTDYVPLQAGTNDISLTQFAMGEVETIGLLKMDFLGLRNLSIIDHTLQIIKRTQKKTVHLNDIPLDDQATFSLFQKGYTLGVFQFESKGIRNVLRQLGPTSLEDIAAVNALYRPGPMDNIDLFIRRKKGLEPVVYPEDSLKEILENTYGIMVYQEQTMQVASKMAGYSLGEADILRRAISKKKKEIIDQERSHFVSGAKKQGYSEDKANVVYDYIERFANYGFNRSHAVAYSMIGYQMAYLKVHYPTAFFTAVLHSVRHQTDKIREYMNEVRRLKIKVVPPDINQSEYSFTSNGQAIFFGFRSLKGIRRDFIQSIIQERKRSGPYVSLENFLLRLEKRWLKVENILPLIYVGAFDSLHPNRRQLVMELEGMVKNIIYTGGSLDLLEILTLKKQHEVPDFTMEEKLNQENEYLGTYISGHPTDGYDRLQLLLNTVSVSQLQIGKTVSVLLYITEVKKIRTKKGESMAFLTGNDSSGEVSVILFPNFYRKLSPLLVEGQVVVIEGKIERNKRNQEIQLLVENLELAKEIQEKTSNQTGYLRIPKEVHEQEYFQRIKEALKQFSGQVPIIIVSEKTGQKKILHRELWGTENKELKRSLSELLGEENVVFK